MSKSYQLLLFFMSLSSLCLSITCPSLEYFSNVVWGHQKKNNFQQICPYLAIITMQNYDNDGYDEFSAVYSSFKKKNVLLYHPGGEFTVSLNNSVSSPGESLQVTGQVVFAV